MSDLADAAVLVTGAGSGIGAAIATAVATAGARVVVNDVDADRAAATCEQITAAGGSAHTVVGDVADEAGAAHVVSTAAESLGGLTGLVNNVGLVRGGPLADLALEHWDLTLRVDLTSMFLVSRAARPLLADGGGRGAIVNLASLVATAPAPGSGAYSAAKAGVVALTQQMALEWGPQGVRVNAISPGLVAGTNFTPQSGNPELAERRGTVVPLRRVASAADIAPVAVFLLSDAARYVHGQVITVDGGLGISVQTHVPG